MNKLSEKTSQSIPFVCILMNFKLKLPMCGLLSSNNLFKKAIKGVKDL